ncbi:hypothetical protein ACQP2P_30765 [Dactylosporangium sp. CA-139114]
MAEQYVSAFAIDPAEPAREERLPQWVAAAREQGRDLSLTRDGFK